jgi:hypothetical protein
MREADDLPAAPADDPNTAMGRTHTLAYAILEGTLIRSTASRTRSPTTRANTDATA